MKKLFLSLWVGGIIVMFSMLPIYAQEVNEHQTQIPKDNYLIGEEKNLEIIVHIWGEVRQAGEKRVPDGTNILDLISKAGGPTEFSNLANVVLYSKQNPQFSTDETSYVDDGLDRFIQKDLEKLHKTGKAEIDINKYLDKGKAQYLPRLLPGDVVHVKRNVWYKWQTFIRVISQIAIVAQVWYWYNRSSW